MARVRDMLALPALKELKIVAGEAGLDRKVEHVTVMEVPDIKQWLKGGDFLITSFYSVRKSDEDQCRLLRELADTCSAVAVKTGKYVDVISEQVRETADACGLPLLIIPFSMTYIDIIVNVMNRIFEDEGTSEILEKYVKDIIYENYSDEILMVERGRLFGLDVALDEYCALNLSFRKGHVPTEMEGRSLRFLCHSLKQSVMEHGGVRECVQVPLKKGYLLLLEGESQDALRTAVCDCFTGTALRALWPPAAEKLLCAAGSVERGMNGIRDTYSTSFKAMHVGRMLYADQFVFSYEKLKTFCALEDFLVSEKGRVFTEVFKNVQSKELLDTLSAYYECDGSLDLTAEKLYTHKNTVKYRLNRLQEQTGLDLKKPDDSFRLYLAMLSVKMGNP